MTNNATTYWIYLYLLYWNEHQTAQFPLNGYPRSWVTLYSCYLNKICAWSKSLTLTEEMRRQISPIRFSEQFKSFISLVQLTPPCCFWLNNWKTNSNVKLFARASLTWWYWNTKISSEIWLWLIRLSFQYFCVSFKCVLASGCSPAWPITVCCFSLVVFSIS